MSGECSGDCFKVECLNGSGKSSAAGARDIGSVRRVQCPAGGRLDDEL